MCAAKRLQTVTHCDRAMRPDAEEDALFRESNEKARLLVGGSCRDRNSKNGVHNDGVKKGKERMFEGLFVLK